MSGLPRQVVEELLAASGGRSSARLALLAAMIRFGSEWKVSGGKLVIELACPSEAVGRFFLEQIEDAFGPSVRGGFQPSLGSKDQGQCTLAIHHGAETLVRRVGLVTRSGHTVVGLPPAVVSGTVEDAEAAWRGAFLMAGTLSDPRRSSVLEVACPGQEAAMALVGCARRMGLTAKSREARGIEKVTLRDGDAAGAMLSRLGAHRSRALWDQQREQRENKPSQQRLANFDDANLRRSVKAAVAAAARVEQALRILGEDVPDHLAQAGQLRVEHRQASLEELGRLADPQMTKDAIAGRIRRLLSMADDRAKELGIPDTKAAADAAEAEAEGAGAGA